jgi:aminodeoxyfutalosine deaminase
MGRTVAAGPRVHRAAWLRPVCQPPIADGCVVERDGRVEQVGAWRDVRPTLEAAAETVDHGDVCLVPGLIDGHAHLELTDHGPIAFDGCFSNWLEQVTARSRAMLAEGLGTFSAAATHGAAMLASTGTAAIADTTLWGARAESDAIVVRVHEVIGFAPDGADRPFLAQALACLREDTRQGIPCAIEPHTPYTVHPEVIGRCAAEARALRRPFAIHLAETPEEVELSERGTGPLREYLESHGVDAADFLPPAGTSPVRRLGALGALDRAVLFHGNYIGPDDFGALVRAGASVVYCPRSHRHFHHAPHPAEAMLRAGVNVCLGTDGLVSNDGLDMREEIRCALERCHGLAPEDALLMATLGPARAFGLDGQLGCLAPGLLARFAELPTEMWA